MEKRGWRTWKGAACCEKEGQRGQNECCLSESRKDARMGLEG